MNVSPRTRRIARGLGLASLALTLLLLLWSAWRSDLRDPLPTVLIRDSRGRYLDELADPEADGVGYWRLKTVPTRVAAATLALEDRRFATHPGVDPRALLRAMQQNVAAGHVVSGASTIAMQLARMQDPAPRSLPHKLLEAGTALALTARHGREAVLAQYLRFAPYGNNIHGIAYAARRYLDKPVDDLSWAETAFLCALPQAPSRTNPFRHDGRRRAVERAGRILDVLWSYGLLDQAELDFAHEQLGRLRMPPKGSRPPEALHAVLRLREQLSDREVWRALGDAPVVTATLDLSLQARVASSVNVAVERWRARGAGNAAVLVVEPRTGRVLVHVGSTDYFGQESAGAIDYANIPRNAGSTLKPLLYAAALDAGALGPDTVLQDRRRSDGGIENADSDALGPMLPRQALGNSRNVPAVTVMRRLGVGRAWGMLRALGLGDPTQQPERYGDGLALGAVPTTLQQLVGAYTALASDGRPRALTWVDERASAPGEQVFVPETTDVLARWLSDPMARLPAFPRLGASELPFPAALKTGTSPDYRDAWTVGWTDEVLVGAWVGHPGNTPMVRLSGFSAAAELVQEVLLDVHADRADGGADHSFPAPAGWTSVPLCAASGQVAGAGCALSFAESFPPGTEPRLPCGLHDGARPMTLTERTYTLRVVSPPDGLNVTPDPEVPSAQATLALEVEVQGEVPQVLWTVDGEPLALVDPPFTARWRVTPGLHRIEARIPHTEVRSEVVRVIGH